MMRKPHLLPVMVLWGSWAVGLLPSVASFHAQAQEVALSPLRNDPVLPELTHRSREQMDPSDTGLVQKKDGDLAREAAFFGYDLSLPGWSYVQTLCPYIPDNLILHYGRSSRDGAISSFTAVVPRGMAEVSVIPVLYHNATPFHPAPGSTRSIEVFNRSISADLANAAAQPAGHWLLLAACYADMAGGGFSTLQGAAGGVALTPAPEAILRLSEAGSNREVVLTDRDIPQRSAVWRLIFDGKGRLVAATVMRLPDRAGHPSASQTPRSKTIPRQELHGTMIPSAPAGAGTPVPQSTVPQ